MFERPTLSNKTSGDVITPITCYVICEGYVDESKYFKAIEKKIKNRFKGNLVFVPIERKTTNSAPIKVCEELRSFIEEKKLKFKGSSNDFAFMIIDRDHHFNGNHLNGTNTALKYCDENSVDVLVNVPSFEVWELCHYINIAEQEQEYIDKLLKNRKDTKHGKPFAKKEVSRLLNGQDYENIVQNLATAIINEKKLREQFPCNEIPPSHVQSNVGKVFMLFNEKGYNLESMFI